MTLPQQKGEEMAVLEGGSYSGLRLERRRSEAAYFVGKRCLDVAAAAAGLLFLMPLFVVLMAAIKWEDPRGPVFFSQTRVGKNGKLFRMYKFRSMVADAENLLDDLLDKNEISGAMFKMRDDPRVTKVGRFIRRTSLDEFPQLFNVLKGDMSLVGPRPPLPREVEKYSEYDMQRLTVTPGCTGLWQISGRNDLSFAQMVELDLQYIERKSIVFDLKVIFRTFALLLGSKNAF